MNRFSSSLYLFVSCLVLFPLLLDALIIVNPTTGQQFTRNHETAAFGPNHGDSITASLVIADPLDGCSPLNKTSTKYWGRIVFILRGGCNFVDKVRNAQYAYARGVIVGDNKVSNPAYIQMATSADDPAEDIDVPAVFIARGDALDLIALLASGTPYDATLDSTGEVSPSSNDFPISNYQSVGLLLMILPVVWCLIVGAYYLHRVWRERRSARARSERSVNLPITKYQPLSNSSSASACTNESCAICLDDFTAATDVKVLPCSHGFHTDCIDPWLNARSDLCPICKRSILDGVQPSSSCFNLC